MAGEPEPEVQVDGTCPECGAATEEKDYCPGCGAPLTTFICPSCYEENPTRADFCSSCNRPLEYISFVDPIRGLEAGGWVLREISRKADERRINMLLFVGAILAFGPYLLYLACLILGTCLSMATQGMNAIGDVSDVILIVGFIVPIGYSLLLLKVLSARRRQALDPRAPAAETPPPNEAPEGDGKAP